SVSAILPSARSSEARTEKVLHKQYAPYDLVTEQTQKPPRESQILEILVGTQLILAVLERRFPRLYPNRAKPGAVLLPRKRVPETRLKVHDKTPRERSASTEPASSELHLPLIGRATQRASNGRS